METFSLDALLVTLYVVAGEDKFFCCSKIDSNSFPRWKIDALTVELKIFILTISVNRTIANPSHINVSSFLIYEIIELNHFC